MSFWIGFGTAILAMIGVFLALAAAGGAFTK